MSIIQELPIVEGVDPLHNPIDAFKIAIARQISSVLPVALPDAYRAVELSKKDGDFTVPVPRFRLPGKPDVHLQSVVKAVGALALLWRELSVDIPAIVRVRSMARRRHWPGRVLDVHSESHDICARCSRSRPCLL